MQLTALTRVEQAAAFVLSGAVVVRTRGGVAPVSQLASGDVLLAANDTAAPVMSCSALVLPGPAVRLPAKAGGAEVLLGMETLLLCNHFLCAALFGQREVAIRVGDVLAPVAAQVPARGPASMYRIETRAGAVLDLGGYRCLAANGAAAPEGLRVLHPEEALQLHQSGILFRHAVTS